MIIPWMSGKFGMMCHFLCDISPAEDHESSVEAWNRQVESINTDHLADQVASTGASWLIFTIGQNSGYFCSPNALYDKLVRREHSRLTRRDLVADVACSLAKHDVRTIAYLPSHAPALDRVAVEQLTCTPDWDASMWQLLPGKYLRHETVDERLSAFQRKWESIAAEWSQRWGHAVSGWWIDGCYYGDKMYHHVDEPNLESFVAALKSGNPEAVVAFNPGVKIACFGKAEDYTAGETMHDLPVAQWEGGYTPLKNPTGNSQLHILTHLGRYWRDGEPRFNKQLAAGYTEYITSLGGAITWDVPIDAEGVISQSSIQQLQTINLNPS